MKKAFTFILIIIAALSVASIAGATDIVNCGNETVVTLWAGQNIDAGSVTVENDGSNLYITFSTTGNWLLAETHVHVGETLADIPHTKNGTPIPGQFDYGTAHQPFVTSYTYTIPLTWDAGTSLVVAAHASLVKLGSNGTIVQQETGWGDGEDFPGNRWATYITYTVQGCDEPGGGTGTTETAFAFGGAYATCFLDLDLNGDGSGDYQRWGWTNGALSPQATAYVFDIYAGAGQCDLEHGRLVGWLTVYYDGSIANVLYNAFDGFTFTETHLYVGNEPLARGVNGGYTIAPGQYPETGTELQYTISGLSGDIYIVAHAVVAAE